MKVDWEKDVETNSAELVPDGFYVLKVKKWEYSKSKTKGTDQIMWTLEVIGGDHEGATLWDYHALLKQSLWRLGLFIKGCNITTEGLKGKKVDIPSPIFDMVLNACIGRKVGANVSVEEYKGRKNNKFSEYSPVEKKIMKPNIIGEDDLPEFLQDGEPPEEELTK